MRYHTWKVNVVVDVLSRKTQISSIMIEIQTLTTQIKNWHPWLIESHLIYNATMGTKLLDQVFVVQRSDGKYNHYRRRAIYENSPFYINDQSQIKYKGRVWLPNNEEVKNEVLTYLHNSKFAIHTGDTKMYKEAK